ncbi:hypothetical protein ACR3K2_09540 [Cryptosporidium serpentis]
MIPIPKYSNPNARDMFSLGVVTFLALLLWLCSLFNTNWQSYTYKTSTLGYIEFNLSLWGFSINSNCKNLSIWSSDSNNLILNRNIMGTGVNEFICDKLNFMNDNTFSETAQMICSINKVNFPNSQAACYNFEMLNLGSLIMIGGITAIIICILFGFGLFCLSKISNPVMMSYAYTSLFGCANLIAIIVLPLYYINAGGAWIAINSLFSTVNFGYKEFTYQTPFVSDIQFFWGYSFAILAFIVSILLPLFGCYFASSVNENNILPKYSYKKFNNRY